MNLQSEGSKQEYEVPNRHGVRSVCCMGAGWRNPPLLLDRLCESFELES